LFFQAEDGIRDFHVTGVQTCALPISVPVPAQARSAGPRLQAGDRARDEQRDAQQDAALRVFGRRDRHQQDRRPALQGQRDRSRHRPAPRVVQRTSTMPSEHVKKLTRKDFTSDQDVRWCPGCGDYAILATMQRTLPEVGADPAKTVFLSGIGCSSRFPYYMNTYGFHSIRGRAPAFATGLKLTNPELDIWVITGDGDGLSIGGNHLMHLLRRNVDVQLILFNNRIYG